MGGRGSGLSVARESVFWQSSRWSLRPHLALFSLLTAYCCWRCWNGEKNSRYGAVALGAGSGFVRISWHSCFRFGSSRPGWAQNRGARFSRHRGAFGDRAGLGGRPCYCNGGVQTFMKIMLDYAVDQSRPESVVFGSSTIAWRRQISRWSFGMDSRSSMDLGSSIYFKIGSAAAHRRSRRFPFIWLVPASLFRRSSYRRARSYLVFSGGAVRARRYVLSLARARMLCWAPPLF